MLNLCLDDEVARFMGVENHVCEVQIVLAAFASLQQVDDCRSPSVMLRCRFFVPRTCMRMRVGGEGGFHSAVLRQGILSLFLKIATHKFLRD